MSERSKWDSDDSVEKSPRYSQASMALLSDSNQKVRENPWASISPRPKRQVNSFARFASDVRPIVQNIWTGKVRARPKSARTTLPPSRPSEWAQHSPAVESQRGDNSTAMAPPSPDLPPSTERRHANADHFSPTALGQPADAGRGDPSHGLSQSAPSGPLAGPSRLPTALPRLHGADPPPDGGGTPRDALRPGLHCQVPPARCSRLLRAPASRARLI